MSDLVAVFDTTLRDGEQAAGTRLGSRDKLTVARQLARLNVDVIEAGYPASSPDDFEAVRQISREIQGPIVCALSRAVPSDIEACGAALDKAARPRIHTGIGASDRLQELLITIKSPQQAKSTLLWKRSNSEDKYSTRRHECDVRKNDPSSPRERRLHSSVDAERPTLDR